MRPWTANTGTEPETQEQPCQDGTAQWDTRSVATYSSYLLILDSMASKGPRDRWVSLWSQRQAIHSCQQ